MKPSLQSDPEQTATPRVYRGSESYRAKGSCPVVTIGNFDGVHRGHQFLIGRLTELAERLEVPSCVYTFDPSPREVLHPERSMARLTSVQEKASLLAKFGVDEVIVESFSHDFASRSASWFAREVIQQRLRARALIVGHDFRFGRQRSGSLEIFQRDLPDLQTEQLGAVWQSDSIISSTAIREALQRGDTTLVREMLGRPYMHWGQVVPGRKQGRSLGFPTANLEPSSNLLPSQGVYSAWVQLPDQTLHPAVANLGVRPTFSLSEVCLEVHLLDFTGDLYDQRLGLMWWERLREERAFSDPDALRAQLQLDVEAARRSLEL